MHGTYTVLAQHSQDNFCKHALPYMSACTHDFRQHPNVQLLHNSRDLTATVMLKCILQLPNDIMHSIVKEGRPYGKHARTDRHDVCT